ncbi:sulfatase/phosphatase domain-containing protein [Niabella hibiscisoli]|uniref:sulfatase/phosphatase domain-containing protein n=1 Tax=Niabella hibiscisoli TaxID=1825928 RepID=UPI001F10D668|nr:sulfatase/phosphatase domain-containing protein [Niabella hibiscisoli]MCH5719475.1 DUF4976 domain-containing protein [Niabella hibiscisoli]
MQGASLLPLVAGKEKPVHNQPVFWEHEGNAAVRLGNLKLVKAYDPHQTDKWELYDVNKDRSELHDLAALRPGLSKSYLRNIITGLNGLALYLITKCYV